MKDELLSLLKPHGQEHLLAFWGQLNQNQRNALAAQIRAIDFALIRRLYESRDGGGKLPFAPRKLRSFAERKATIIPTPIHSDFRQLAERAEPPPAFRLDAAKNRFTPRAGPSARPPGCRRRAASA